MKKLFYLVLLLNAGFFAWIVSQDEAPVPEVKTMVDQKPSLVLLDEINPTAGIGSKPESPTGTEQSRTQTGVLEHKEKAIPQKTRPVETAVVQAPEPQVQTQDEQQGVAPKGDKKTTPETMIDNTLSENKETQKTVNCFELGSFPTMAVADKVSARFRAAGIWSESRLHIQEQKQGHVIYIPTEGSYERATQIIAMVKDKGIRDHAILAVDGVRNTVVMGIYRTNTAAKRRIKQLLEHGFDARMKEHIRKRPRYLVNFRESDNKPVPEELWSQISHEYPKVNRAARVCE